MDLELLDFECSEDAEGVVCWDALAQPHKHHNAALLQEVSEVLAWAYLFNAQGPGRLEDGAQWDYDLQATLHAEDQAPSSAQIVFNPSTGQTTITPLSLHQRIELGLSLSGTPAFAQAFRDHWDAP
ncbi:hypothetical protein [Limnohabitans sp. 2KL-27]|jgi:hypothetical protein|uniref:hypothetical protein n=1 Tax=Limnohabitans sp. 2KL-27 TaxID=1100705 RepID=UPI000A82A153|nr:hypothetical protein [Limnohabitans sp. 2KL-27]